MIRHTASIRLCTAVAALVALAQAAPLGAAQVKPTQPAGGAKPAAAAPAEVTPGPGYRIGQDDVLSIFVWKVDDLSREVVVRPDGKISLPLLNDVQAVGLTPDELRVSLTKLAAAVVQDPTVTVSVKAINSRKVAITGEVKGPGVFPLNGPTTVLQLIATAGGLMEYANAKHILILRTENGVTKALPFNYNDVVEGKNLKQNIELKPGDIVAVR